MTERELLGQLATTCENLANLCKQQQEQIATLERSMGMLAGIVKNNNDKLALALTTVAEHERIITAWQRIEAGD